MYLSYIHERRLRRVTCTLECHTHVVTYMDAWQACMPHRHLPAQSKAMLLPLAYLHVSLGPQRLLVSTSSASSYSLWTASLFTHPTVLKTIMQDGQVVPFLLEREED